MILELLKINFEYLFNIVVFNLIIELIHVSKDPIKEYLKDPDKKAKYFLVIVVVRIIVTFLMVIGVFVLILRLLGII